MGLLGGWILAFESPTGSQLAYLRPVVILLKVSLWVIYLKKAIKLIENAIKYNVPFQQRSTVKPGALRC